MYKNIKFNINRKIEILMEDGVYKSNVQDLERDYIGISIPVKDGQYLPLKTGEKVEGVYYDEKNIYKFYTTVKGRKIDRIMMILLHYPTKFIKIQRRNFVRVPLVINVCCGLLNKDLDFKNIGDNQIEFFDAFSIDMSAGGIKIATERNIKIGDILMITLPLKNEVLTLKCKAVRIDRDFNNNKNLCGLTFMDLENKTREKIIKMLFQIMREQRKKAPKGD
ncbi:flagellar brake protein [Clostridium rectalis]|uniref:flagellar brake protein n=1 Tax=Clostridium rectalis TaxID=2040295 RepID=UPI000F630B68|nr:flagellar brake domain-containing protein [Clostridium rectalis]